MKKIFLLMLITSAVFAQTGRVQHKTVSMGPAPIIEKTSGSLNTVGDNPAVKAFGWEFTSKSTLSMPIPAGTPFNTLNIFLPPGGSFASSMTKGGNGNYYLITHEPALYNFNPVSGAVTLIGSISGLSENPNGISYNPANTSYYLITAQNLYSFNITTRAATLIGNMGIPNSAFIDLCFTEGGACYAYDIGTEASYIINPSTGAATYLGPLGYTANYGQGMSYDMETGTIYLSAYNYDVTHGQLRIMDPGTGLTTLVTDWGNQQIPPFALDTQFPSPSNIPAPSNPNPSDGAVNVPLNGSTLSWINGTGTVSTEIWFGSVGNVMKVYDGPAVTSYSLPVLEYNKKYLWWVICKNTSGKTQGLPWSFTTVMNPNQVTAFYDSFDNLDRWTLAGPLGQSNWSIYTSTNAGGSPPSELMLFYDPVFNGMSRVMSQPINSSSLYSNTISWRQYAEYYLGAAPEIGVAVTYDGGTTYTTLWQGQIGGLILAEQKSVTFTPLSNTYRLIFYFNGNSYNINLWDIDDVQIDYIVPVELTSFTASAAGSIIELNWQTSTETNNKGFEIQRSKGDEFQAITFVNGNGTSSDPHSYSYSDNNLDPGRYSYRLKQIDFDGSWSFSPVVEVEIASLKEYSLEQNYPNPFNPSTSISFNLAVDSKVSLKVFDILGREVSTLINAGMAAGSHNIDFNAVGLNSGVYFYRIEAAGNNVENFVDIKKMLLIK